MTLVIRVRVNSLVLEGGSVHRILAVPGQHLNLRYQEGYSIDQSSKHRQIKLSPEKAYMSHSDQLSLNTLALQQEIAII